MASSVTHEGGSMFLHIYSSKPASDQSRQSAASNRSPLMLIASSSWDREAGGGGAGGGGHAAPPPIDIAAGPIDGIRGITFGEHCSYGRKNRARDTLSEVLSLSPKCSSALVNNSEARRMITRAGRHYRARLALVTYPRSW